MATKKSTKSTVSTATKNKVASMSYSQAKSNLQKAGYSFSGGSSGGSTKSSSGGVDWTAFGQSMQGKSLSDVLSAALAYDKQTGGSGRIDDPQNLSALGQSMFTNNFSAVNPNFDFSGLMSYKEPTDVSTLTDVFNQSEIPFQSMPSTAAGADAFIGSVMGAQQIQTEEQAQLSEVQKRSKELDNLVSRFDSGESYRDLQEESGANEIRKQLQQANVQLAQMQSQYQIENQNLRQQQVPMPFIIGQQNELANTAAIQIGAQASYVQALQGNLELANHYVDKMIDLQQRDFEIRYNTAKNNLDMAMAFLDRGDKKRAQQLQFEMDLYSTEHKNTLEFQREALKNANLNGAPGAVIHEIAAAKTLEEIQSAGGSYISDALASAQLTTERLRQQGLRQDLEAASTISPISPYQAERAARTIQSVDELSIKAQQSPGIFGATAAMPIPKFLRTSEFRNFNSELDTLKSNIAFGELTAMREASKTGGALGQVSDREGQLLQSALGALDMSQSPENFQKQLSKIKASIQRWNNAVASQGMTYTITSPTGELIEIID